MKVGRGVGGGQIQAGGCMPRLNGIAESVQTSQSLVGPFTKAKMITKQLVNFLYFGSGNTGSEVYFQQVECY